MAEMLCLVAFLHIYRHYYIKPPLCCQVPFIRNNMFNFLRNLIIIAVNLRLECSPAKTVAKLKANR